MRRARTYSTAPIMNGASKAYSGGSRSAIGSHHADSRSRETPVGCPSRRMASMQITAAASSAPNSSRSRLWMGVSASSQPIRPRTHARTVTKYTMSDAGMESRGQHHGHLIRRRRPQADQARGAREGVHEGHDG